MANDEICMQSFSRHSDLERHVAAVHLKRRAGPCATCSQTYARTDAFKRHLIDGKNECREHYQKLADEQFGDSDRWWDVIKNSVLLPSTE